MKLPASPELSLYPETKQSETGLSQGLPRNNSVTRTGMPKRPVCTMLLIEDNCSGLEPLPHKGHDLYINAVDATT
jgi:hypothetical protein